MPRIDGTNANDVLDGSVEPDQIYGLEGDDVLDGHENDDELFGGLGDDTLLGGEGNDTIAGGEGADVIRGEAGSDVLDYSASDAGIDIDLTEQDTNIVSPGVTAAVGSGGHAQGDIVRGMENVIGSDFDDTITLNDAGDGTFADGGAGDDLITGSSDDNLLIGGTGDDTIIADGASGGGGGLSGIELLQNGSFEDGTHAANGVNGLDGWSNAGGSPDSADDGTSAESWNPANSASDGTGYVTMWARSDRPQEAMQQTLGTPLEAGTTYTLQVDAISADRIGSTWFTPTDIPVSFEILDANGSVVLGSVVVQGTSYETYTIEFTPSTNVNAIIVRPNTAGEGTYPSVIIDNMSIREGTIGAASAGGNDTIDAGDGEDVIHDSAGDDSISGGEGRDEFVYTTITGNDTVVGGELNDTAAVNSGDKLNAHESVEDLTVIFDGDESGVMTGGSGSVTFSEIEHILGGQGEDSIDASASSVQQILDGGEGADTITGGTGDDIIAMGLTQDYSATDGDNDLLVLEDDFGNDSIEGFEVPTDLGGGAYAGNDQVDVTGLTDAAGNPVNVNDVMVTDTNGDGTGDAILSFPNGESLTLWGVSPSDVSSDDQLIAMGIPAAPPSQNFVVDGTAAGEIINTGYGGDPEGDMIDNNDHSDGSNDDSVDAGGGNDTIASGFGNDTVDAGEGDDLVYAETGDDLVVGGAGNDSVFGESGNDTLLGGTGADSLDGGDNEDSLVGGIGNDTLWGQDGKDTLVGGADDDFANGGYGDDSISGGDGNDFLEGWYGDDTIDGGAGNDFIDADIDSDLVYGGDGNDTVMGGFSVSSDTIYGGAGNDSLDGQSGDDLIYGGTGDDEVFGSFGDDTIFLEDGFGADTLQGGEGDETNGDTLDLSLVTTDTTIDLTSANPETGSVSDGTDTAGFVEIENIVLGGGRDTIVLADGSGADAVQAFDMTDSGDGTTNDQLDVSGLTSDGGTTPVHTGDVTVTDTNGDGTGDAVLTFPGGESITLVGVLASQVDSAAELESIGIPAASGGGLDYIVEGTSGNDSIDGSYLGDPEGDMVDNNDHSDGSNDDSIQAGAGNDTINGGAGNDTIDAGQGIDEVIFSDGFGNDTVDGGTGIDGLVFSDLTGPISATVSGVNAGDVTSGANSVSFTNVEDITATHHDDTIDLTGSTSDFYVFAEDGNDTIIGGAARDFAYGQLGDDLIQTGAGNDWALGGSGDDTLEAGSGNDLVEGWDGDDVINLTGGNDTVTGDNDADTITVIAGGYADGAVVTIDGGTGGNDIDTLDLSSWSAFQNLTQTADADGDSHSGSIEAQDASGNWITINFSEIESIICFTKGTKILTPMGERDVDTLQPGDKVITRDNGLQPIRWVGKRTVPGLGTLAPISFAREALPQGREPLLVSPQHRMLLTGYQAELLFGTREVLIPAKHLVNGADIRQTPCAEVTYVHIMFDRHEIIFSNGQPTESFFAGETGLDAVEEEAREELFTIFPELRWNKGAHGQAARLCLKGHEAEVLSRLCAQG